jgi:hypothetical protein
MDSLEELLDWVIQTMHCKADRMKALLKQVSQPVGLLNTEDALKLKADVVYEMDHLVNDSL